MSVASPIRLAGLVPVALLVGLFFSAPTQAARSDLPRARLEAAFLVNFVRFTQWPVARFASVDSPYVLTVVGADDVASAVREVTDAAGIIHGRRISVRQVDGDDVRRHRQTMRGSHVVFVHRSAGIPSSDALRLVSGASVLTVGDSPGFARAGGMLGLVASGPRMAFIANPDAIRASGLSVSAKVLKLARDIDA